MRREVEEQAVEIKTGFANTVKIFIMKKKKHGLSKSTNWKWNEKFILHVCHYSQLRLSEIRLGGKQIFSFRSRSCLVPDNQNHNNIAK